MHRLATAYGQDPAILAGIDPTADSWLAWQLRRAVFAFGDWFERMREATVERPAPRDAKPTVRVPRYSEEQLRAMLGLDEAGRWSPAAIGRPVAESALDARAEAFLRGEVG